VSTPTVPAEDTGRAEQELRRYAIGRLRKKREFQAHLLAYVCVNAFLVAIWLFTMPGGFFWPVFPIFGWGIGLAFHAWDTFAPATPSEEQIQREMARLRGSR
jgi:uncharacterized membrane protein